MRKAAFLSGGRLIRKQLASASPELRASTFGALDKESCYLAPTERISKPGQAGSGVGHPAHNERTDNSNDQTSGVVRLISWLLECQPAVEGRFEPRTFWGFPVINPGREKE